MIDLSTISVLEAEETLTFHQLETPLMISSGSVTTLIELTATVQVGNGSGTTAVGSGSICLSDLWAWPGAVPSRERKLEIMINYCRDIGRTLRERTAGPAHPLELGLRLHDDIVNDHEHPAPVLARAVCASPYDAAIHDAAGRLARSSAFDLYRADAPIPSADSYFPDGAVRAIRRTLSRPRTELPGWWLIGMTDDLDVVGRRVRQTGISQFKLKLSGIAPIADAHRVVQVYRAATRWVRHPRLSVDTNEGSPNPAVVLTFLTALAQRDPAAYRALDYLEQPTPRESLDEFDWHEVTERKLVLLDEGFTDLDQLATARKLGWSGLALKTCKGHSVILAAAAWARQNGLAIALQDLTNPGLAAIHSFLVGAYLNPMNGIELNSPQYMPRANTAWMPRLAGLFQVQNGQHRLDTTDTVGLASNL